jgi:hypothetical protein
MTRIETCWDHAFRGVGHEVSNHLPLYNLLNVEKLTGETCQGIAARYGITQQQLNA